MKPCASYLRTGQGEHCRANGRETVDDRFRGWWCVGAGLGHGEAAGRGDSALVKHCAKLPHLNGSGA